MFLVNLFSWCKLLVQKHLNPIGQYLFTLFPFFMAHKSQNSATSRQKGQEGQEVKKHFLFKYGQKETLKKSVKAAYSKSISFQSLRHGQGTHNESIFKISQMTKLPQLPQLFVGKLPLLCIKQFQLTFSELPYFQGIIWKFTVLAVFDSLARRGREGGSAFKFLETWIGIAQPGLAGQGAGKYY